MTNQTQDDKSTGNGQSSASQAGSRLTVFTRLERFISAGHSLVIILGAIIAAIVWGFDHLNSRIDQNIEENVTKVFENKLNARVTEEIIGLGEGFFTDVINNQIYDPEKPLGELYECVKAIETRGFGEWDLIKAGEVASEPAESDGFIIAFNRGNEKIAKFSLNTNKEKKPLDDLKPTHKSSTSPETTRSRAGVQD